ncbi:MAG: methyltransferase type 11 [Flavipsychrobacter sp.]|jgi:2-polyprenyl-3-methyl-5-hydroxy-6-metoxy-1,4-benzoquinol methylase|nr:methyltransferase type 11 [Flavipsychrobacter sp.]
MGWYLNWFGSPYYKILYQNRDEYEAREFVENLLAYLRPRPGSNMLDIACGEGRFARQLAEHDYKVTGIDISIESIDVAKAYETDNLQFFTHDMRMPFYINYFDYAFNFFTSFGYFEHDRDHALAARSFAAALKPEGILVIDYLNFEHVAANFVTEETIERGGYTFHIKRRIERSHIVKDITFMDAENIERHFTESVAAFTLADFNKMFKNAEMSLIGTFGDYGLEQYHPIDSPRLIMIFKKKYA